MSRLEQIDRRLALKAGAVQLLAVGVVFALLALALPRSFFEDWGIVAGPAAWIACAALTARILHLPTGRILLVAAGAGLLGAAAGLGGRSRRRDRGRDWRVRPPRGRDDARGRGGYGFSRLTTSATDAMISVAPITIVPVIFSDSSNQPRKIATTGFT
jgi:hypothetical protein